MKTHIALGSSERQLNKGPRMFEIVSGNLEVEVATTNDGGLTPEYWADRATRHIVSVSDKAPQPIRDQAYAFRNLVEQVVTHYMREAINSDRTTLAAQLRKQGHDEIAKVIGGI